MQSRPRPGQASGQLSWVQLVSGQQREHTTPSQLVSQCERGGGSYTNKNSDIHRDNLWISTLYRNYSSTVEIIEIIIIKNEHNYLQETARDSLLPSDLINIPHNMKCRENYAITWAGSQWRWQLSISEIQISHRDPKEEEVNLEPALLSNIIPLRHSY